MAAIAELDADRVVEGTFAVARKQRLRTRGGAPYLALELVDPSGRIDARVWNDVELLDTRFAEGDAVRVLGRVERFRDKLQLEIRSLEAAPEANAAGAGGSSTRSRTGHVTLSPRRSVTVAVMVADRTPALAVHVTVFPVVCASDPSLSDTPPRKNAASCA